MSISYASTVERWGVQDICVPGFSDGNPFTEREIWGTFTSKNEKKRVRGFYDGDGTYRVRFMPSFAEPYTFEIEGSFSHAAYTGAFDVLPASEGNHGPVRVCNETHFAYEDGTPHFSFGTTCYVWALQSDEMIAQTFETLKNAPFNKIRFCIFPKHYDFNLHEPRSYPYEGTPMDSFVLTPDNFQNYAGRAEGNAFDYTRFNPEHFRHLERCIARLCAMGIEADLIVMHPYDRWGFSCMTKEQDDLYWRYVIARFAAFRNVWWSLANEYDLMPQKSIADWERYADILCTEDPYAHLRSIHNCLTFYNHSRPWVTHCSIQRQDLYRTTEYFNDFRATYRKPVVGDEIAYEGNIPFGWGNISGEELTRRFWEAVLRGGYAGHGETYLHESGMLWWSHGGMLRGESPARIAFLRRIIEETNVPLRPWTGSFDETVAVEDTKEVLFTQKPRLRLHYYGFQRPSYRDFYVDETTPVHAEIIDTWNMTVTDAGVHTGKFRLNLPARAYMAVRLTVGTEVRA